MCNMITRLEGDRAHKADNRELINSRGPGTLQGGGDCPNEQQQETRVSF